MILKRVLKVCVLALAIVGAILSCTALFYYNQNKPVLNAVLVSPADDTTAYSFTSSYLPFLVSFYDTNNFSQVGSNLEFTSYESFSFVLSDNKVLFQWYNNLSEVDIDSEPFYQSFNFTFDNDWHNAAISYSGVGDYYYFVSVRATIGFNFNVVKFTIGTENGYRGDLSIVSSYIDFIDSNDNTVRIIFGFTPNDNFNIYNSMLPRTYFIVSSFNDNDYYNSGYNTGYSDGLSVGQSNGYGDGYIAGYDVGSSVGFDNGVLSANDYSFLGLIGAVVDAPIQAFINLLNFNVFGFNMLSLCTGLLTLSLIILVVRLVLVKR